MTLFLATWRLWVAAAVLAGLVGLGLYVRHLQHDNASLRVAVAAAQAQASIEHTAGQITERTVTHEVVITRRTEEAAHEVQALPGAEPKLDPAFRDGLLDRVERLRSPDGTGANPDLRGPVAALPPSDP